MMRHRQCPGEPCPGPVSSPLLLPCSLLGPHCLPLVRLKSSSFFRLGVFLSFFDLFSLPTLRLYLWPPFALCFVSLPRHLMKPGPALLLPRGWGWARAGAGVGVLTSVRPSLPNANFILVLSESIYFYCLSCSKAIFQEQKGQHVQD